MVPAQAAPIRLKQPLKGSLQSVPRPRGSKIDGFAVRAEIGEKSPEDWRHHDHRTCALAVWDGTSECAGRLAARAALTCSGVLTSGSDSLIRSLPRATWRLWRFVILLFMAVQLSSSTIPQTIASVVSMRDAIEAAFCSAERVTLAGSITPAFTRSSYSSVDALNPK